MAFVGLSQQGIRQVGNMGKALNGGVEVARRSNIGQSPHKRDERLNFKMETARRLYDSWSPVIRKWAQEPDVEIEFRLGRKTAHKFDTNVGQEAFQKLLGEKKYRILVNCRELNYISSAGLGVFMAFIEDVRAEQGDIKMSNMSAKVFNIFDLLGFPVLYDIVKDEQEALTKFGAQ